VSEPHSTIAAASWAAGISLTTGVLFGLSWPALVWGFIGGLAALKLEDPGRTQRKLWNRVTTVALGTFAAAVSAHPVAEILHPVQTPTELWVPAAAFVIGAGAEMLLRPLLLGLAHRIRQVFGIVDQEDRT
jgi:hypothetical protein